MGKLKVTIHFSCAAFSGSSAQVFSLNFHSFDLMLLLLKSSRTEHTLRCVVEIVFGQYHVRPPSQAKHLSFMQSKSEVFAVALAVLANT